MKTTTLLAVGLLFTTSVLFAAPNDAGSASKQMQIYPKNLARQNVGTNLFVYNPTNQNFVPTEAAAAWLDDDVATGWPPLPGKNYYLLSLTEAQLLTNFSISAKAGASGTVTLYAGDEPAPPTAKSWTPIVKDISLDAINNKRLAKPFSRFAKYILIETNLAEPSPWYSLYLYGDKQATAYHLQKREKSIDATAVFGQFVNNQTVFNLSSLYTNSTIIYSNSSDSSVAQQKAIDDNPETSITIAPSANSGLIVQYGEPRQIQRISVFADSSAKGRLDFYLVSSLPGASPVPAPSTTSNDNESHYIKTANTQADTTPVAGAGNGPVSLDGMTPTVSLVLDGSTGRGSIDFPPVMASNMIVRWTPETAGQNVSLFEINSFGDLSLNDYELVSDQLPAVAEAPDMSKESDGKDKQAPPPVGELLPGKNPFLPAGLGFPPNLPNVLSP